MKLEAKIHRYPDCRGLGVTATDFEKRDVPIVPASVLIKTPPSLSQAWSGVPSAPPLLLPSVKGETEWEVNRGLLDDDLEPIDCQSRQIAIVPLDSRLELLLNSFATITCCHVGLHVPVYNFTIQDHKISPPWTSTTSGSCLWWWSTWVWFYEQTEVLLKVGQTSCRTYTIGLCLQFDQMKWNTIQDSDGKMRWTRAVGTKMGSKGDTASGGLFYKSASLYKCLRTNRPLCVPALWAGWAAALRGYRNNRRTQISKISTCQRETRCWWYPLETQIFQHVSISSLTDIILEKYL